MKLIGLQDLLNRIYMAYCRKCKHQRCHDCKISNVKQMIYESTVCDVDPGEVRPRGKWEYYSTTMQECSVCKRHTPRHRYEFCPRCGAKMEE